MKTLISKLKKHFPKTKFRLEDKSRDNFSYMLFINDRPSNINILKIYTLSEQQEIFSDLVKEINKELR